MASGVENARARRATRSTANVRGIEWFIEEVSETIEMTMRNRLAVAVELVKSKVVVNISQPVTKTRKKTSYVDPATGKRRVVSKTVVTDRSKPGEFPRADTTLLSKTIFGKVVKEGSLLNGYVGTPLSYGLRLETQMNRSFLVRTLREEQENVKRILTGPIAKGEASGFGTSGL
jgi:hypothetical protein